ncbi:hypothetical protein BRC97_01530 [Halobacteriales archaeon QS_6_71_20]|nr:MAG: hypothetical protein BRC97_01530 [Halobacteriales archaeon QS_6_71_20]
MTTNAREAGERGPERAEGSEAGPDSDGTGRSRRWAVLAVLPFLAVGIGDVVLLLIWGIDPLWGFAILPPILFCSVLAYIVFSTDFLEGRT